MSIIDNSINFIFKIYLLFFFPLLIDAFFFFLLTKKDVVVNALFGWKKKKSMGCRKFLGFLSTWIFSWEWKLIFSFVRSFSFDWWVSPICMFEWGNVLVGTRNTLKDITWCVRLHDLKEQCLLELLVCYVSAPKKFLSLLGMDIKG